MNPFIYSKFEKLYLLKICLESCGSEEITCAKFEKAFDYILSLGKELPTVKCSSQNSTSVDILLYSTTKRQC